MSASIVNTGTPECNGVDPFPLEVLPAPLAEFVIVTSHAIACPPDYVAVPMLAVLGTAIGTGHRIEVKPGWREFPILWTATVGDTGTAKSPAQDKAVEPLVRLQNELLKAFEEARKAKYSGKKAEVQTEREGAVQSGSPETDKEPGSQETAVATKDAEVPSQSPAPKLHQVLTTDTTLEALNTILADNPRGIALVQDELTAWVLAMNEYKKGSGADRPHWQSIWNGSQIVVNRKTNFAPIIIPRPFVSVVGGLPPAMLSELCDERGREDGFIHRILFSFPDSMPRQFTDEGISSKVMTRYCEVFNTMCASRLNLLLADRAVTLYLEPDALAVFKNWANDQFAEMDCGPVNLRGPWAKLVTYCARLALIIHLVRKVCGDPVYDDVDKESIDRAIALVKYFKSHARKVYHHLYASNEEKQITKAVEWLKKRPGCVASAREFVTYKVGGVANRDQALALFEKLEDNRWGCIQRHNPPRGGPETTEFRLDCRPNAGHLQMVVGGRK